MPGATALQFVDTVSTLDTTLTAPPAAQAEKLAAYNSAVDTGATGLSPGVLLHAHAIRDAIARGLDTYDFLRGYERYKFDLGGTAVQLHRLVAVRR